MTDPVIAGLNPGEQLYEYYQRQHMLPTHGDFTASMFEDYKPVRRTLYRDKLKLPAGLFEGAKLVEFGPDTGQNSLVFAHWGAFLTLVEPNPDAWQHIERYFGEFGLSKQLVELARTDVQHFQTTERFRFVLAEGSLHIVKPDNWLEPLTRMVDPDGFFVFSYAESSGFLMDLLLRAVYLRFRELSGLERYEAGRQLLQVKWDTISHFRPIEAWVMDLLDLPYLRLALSYDAAKLCHRMFDLGMDLYSSWPAYQDALHPYWGKTRLPDEEQLQRTVDFIERSRLSFAFGGKLFLGGATPGEVQDIGAALDQLISSVDRLIDGFDNPAIDEGRRAIEKLVPVVGDRRLVVETVGDRTAATELLASLDGLLGALGARDAEALRQYCATDRPFLRTWGSPHQYGVYQWRQPT